MVLAVCIAALTTGCEKNDRDEYYRFKTIREYKDGFEMVDKDTGYGYFKFYGGGGVVPLFDEYGNPYRENGWRDIGG